MTRLINIARARMNIHEQKAAAARTDPNICIVEETLAHAFGTLMTALQSAEIKGSVTDYEKAESIAAHIAAKYLKEATRYVPGSIGERMNGQTYAALTAFAEFCRAETHRVVTGVFELVDGKWESKASSKGL